VFCFLLLFVFNIVVNLIQKLMSKISYMLIIIDRINFKISYVYYFVNIFRIIIFKICLLTLFTKISFFSSSRNIIFLLKFHSFLVLEILYFFFFSVVLVSIFSFAF